jgi:hypothetical protein
VGAWSHRILLGGVDITSRTLLGSVRVEEIESGSALMDVVWRPDAGQEATPVVLRTLALDVDTAGGTSWTRLFLGDVISATWGPRSGTYSIVGSTRLQEHFRALATPAAVLSELTGAVWSEALFGTYPDDLWEVAQGAMSTISVDVHIDRAGALALVDWEAAGTADHTLTSAHILSPEDAQLVEADADTKPTQVIVECTYTVVRHKVRSHAIGWAYYDESETSDFCTWIQSSYWVPPTLADVGSTLDGSSWQVPGGMQSEQIPLDVPDLCFSGMPALGWYFERDSNPLLSVTATGYQALAQDIRETYTLTLTAEGAETLYGARVTERRTAALQPEAPDTWPPGGAVPTELGSTDSLGDDYEDQEDETARAAMLQCAYQWGATRLLYGQRQDSRRFVTELRPDISLADTVRVNCYGLDTTGKVRRLVHTLAPYRTEGECAISRGGGTSDAWSVPARPDSTDPQTYWEAVIEDTYPTITASTTLPTYVGSRTTSATEADPHTAGWWTNAINYPGFGGETEKIYTPEFVVEWPAIEEYATSPVELSVAVALEVATPEDIT